jgi:hypothetical protein
MCVEMDITALDVTLFLSGDVVDEDFAVFDGLHQGLRYRQMCVLVAKKANAGITGAQHPLVVSG